MRIRRLLVKFRTAYRRRNPGAGLFLSLAAHGLVVALILLWPGVENWAAPPKLALIVDLVEDRSPGSDAPLPPAGPAPAAPAAPAARAPVGASDAKPVSPAAQGIETPRPQPLAGADTAATVGDLLRGAEAAHGGTAAHPATGGGGVFDTADAGGTGTASLEDFIRVQITRRWQIDPNAPDVHVSLRILIAADGSILAAAPASYGGEDRVYRALAISARNAALLSSPLQFPRGTMVVTGEMVIDLSTREARR